jgi:hypothetical protein
MKNQQHSERISTEPAVPTNWKSPFIDCEEIESRLASLNRRYETATDAAAQAGAEYRLLRGSGSRPTAAIETQRRRWMQLEQWRRTVGATIERLEDFTP